jgi:hypothetical protein
VVERVGTREWESKIWIDMATRFFFETLIWLLGGALDIIGLQAREFGGRKRRVVWAGCQKFR